MLDYKLPAEHGAGSRWFIQEVVETKNGAKNERWALIGY